MAMSAVEARVASYSDETIHNFRARLHNKIMMRSLNLVGSKEELIGQLELLLAVSKAASGKTVDAPSKEQVQSYVQTSRKVRQVDTLISLDRRLVAEQRRRGGLI